MIGLLDLLSRFFWLCQHQSKANKCRAADAIHPASTLTMAEPAFGILSEERVGGVYAKKQQAECTNQSDELWGVAAGWINELRENR